MPSIQTADRIFKYNPRATVNQNAYNKRRFDLKTQQLLAAANSKSLRSCYSMDYHLNFISVRYPDTGDIQLAIALVRKYLSDLKKLVHNTKESNFVVDSPSEL